MFLAAIVREDGIQISVVEVDDALWGSSRAAIEALLGGKEMDAQALDSVGRFEVERRCHELGDVAEWVATLNADED